LAKSFIQETAMVNAGSRLTAAAALKHPWVEKTIASWKLPNELVVSFDLFRIAPPLKRIGLNALAKKAPPSKYRSLFTDLDTTESGSLTRDEFMEAFKHSGNSDEELEDLFEKLDVNCNGEIMYTEFLAATLEAEGELEEAQLQEAFDLIARKAKHITKKCVSRIVGASVKNAEKSRVKAYISDVFKNKDKYDYEEFATMFEHGFDSNRLLGAITETSLNEAQLSQLKEDDLAAHMEAIRENEEQ
jgi:Ca2+-binding EF-hand superfamily protein